MKVGIYSPYLDSLGGGERYILTIAEFFLTKGDAVDIFWDKPGSMLEMSERFGLNLAAANFAPNPFALNLFEKLQQTSTYDLIVVLSDGSIPLSFAKNNWIHLQVPFQVSNRPKLLNKLKLKLFKKVICNSKFTKNIIDQTYGVTSTVLYPPVDVSTLKPGLKKNIILSVGRFAKSKKHAELIAAFKKLNLWQLIIAGSYNPDISPDIKIMEDQVKGSKVSLEPNATLKRLKQLFEEASIYWHAAGFGEDLTAHPERAEHFGITTVEAMAAGSVPVVFAGGGQLEIVEDGKTGFFWTTEEELIAKTHNLIKDKKLLARVSQAAVLASKNFSKEKFYQGLEALLS